MSIFHAEKRLQHSRSIVARVSSNKALMRLSTRSNTGANSPFPCPSNHESLTMSATLMLSDRACHAVRTQVIMPIFPPLCKYGVLFLRDDVVPEFQGEIADLIDTAFGSVQWW